MAAAAVELAESCQRSERTSPGLHRGLSIGLVLVATAVAIFAAANGDILVVGSTMLVALTNIGQLIFNPRVRPQNVTRSLEASKRVVAARV